MLDDARNLELLVRDGDVGRFELRESAAPHADDLGTDEILVRVEKFGLTANNVTYAVLGRSLQYFAFFPAAEEGWGKVPVWGMGRIVASRHPGLAVGARLYGYLPLARFATLRPARLTPTGFDVDRGALPAVYNQYALVGSDPFHLPEHEDHMMLFRPLFFTDFFLDDYLIDGHACFGAEAIVVSSASAKTSFGLAFMLARRRDGGSRRPPHVIGLTSARHRSFVEGLGLYDRTLTYDDVGSLSRDVPAVFVDVAGHPGTLAAVRAHLGAAFKAGVLVGMSHWDAAAPAGAAGGLPEMSADTQFFFAPSWVETRLREWGPARMVEKVSAAWLDFLDRVDAWCQLAYRCGPAGVTQAYRALLEGSPPPDQGYVLSLWEDAFDGPAVVF